MTIHLEIKTSSSRWGLSLFANLCLNLQEYVMILYVGVHDDHVRVRSDPGPVVVIVPVVSGVIAVC